VPDNPYLFKFDKKKVRLGEPYPTPRSWELLNNTVKAVGWDFQFLAGCVGEGVATELEAFHEVSSGLPDAQSILDGLVKEVPQDSEISVLYALSSSLVSAMLYRAEAVEDREGERKAKESFDNLIRYVEGLPVEFSVLTVKSLFDADDDGFVRRLSENSPAYFEWAERHYDLVLGEEGE